MAKKAVDSTLRRILNYTAEIIISIFLLVTICIPLAFTIPMWFEYVIFNVPRTELAINPANWWGLDGTLWVTLFLALVSLTVGYLYIIKIKPGDTSVAKEIETDDDEYEEEKVSDDVAAGDIPTGEIAEEAVDDIPLEDQEDDELDLDEIEESLEEESEED
ncbi:MAG: hypothetical protein E4H14_10385 [Candidatus Thorarchaeota archaeon]|nr:MAG: hypothetical protein E4H14_10385 [Candidatus Thorarchaeota archaeon]